jgi:hypothetical protein
MSRKTKSKKTISAQDILETEIIINQALIDVLIAKRLFTEEELLKSIQNIKRELSKIAQ